MTIIGVILSSVTTYFAVAARYDATLDLRVEKKVLQELAGPKNDIQALKESLGKLSARLDTFIEFAKPLIERRLRDAAGLPADKFNEVLKDVAPLVSIAANNNISQDLVYSIGEKALETAAAERTLSGGPAWITVLNAVRLRSANTPLSPGVDLKQLPIGRWRYAMTIINGKAPTVQFFPRAGVPADLAAKFEEIDEPTKVEHELASSVLYISGGALRIDGYYIRNVVFKGVEVHYSASRVRLDNVVFVDCTFAIDNTPSGRSLARQLLASSSLSYRAGV